MVMCGRVDLQEVVGGFIITPEFADQLQHVFPRIVFALRLRFLRAPSSTSSRKDSDPSTPQDCSVQQWLNGAKVMRGHQSAVITLTDADAGGVSDARIAQVIVSCRGPSDQRRQLFFLQVSI